MNYNIQQITCMFFFHYRGEESVILTEGQNHSIKEIMSAISCDILCSSYTHEHQIKITSIYFTSRIA